MFYYLLYGVYFLNDTSTNKQKFHINLGCLDRVIHLKIMREVDEHTWNTNLKRISSCGERGDLFFVVSHYLNFILPFVHGSYTSDVRMVNSWLSV